MSAAEATAELPLQGPWGTLRGTVRALLVPLLSLVAALAIGGLIIIFSDPQALNAWGYFFSYPWDALRLSWDAVYNAYLALLRGSVLSADAWSETLVQMTPLVFTGLSVALGFRAGLFNIGGDGQVLAGSLMSVLVGFSLPGLPIGIHLPLALLAGALGGAVWGFIPGLLKARTGAHEVISTIMLNYVGLFLVAYLLLTDLYQRPGRSDPISKLVAPTARLPQVGTYRVNLGIVLALAAAALIWWLLRRTTLGFSIKAVGANPSAAAYAGIDVRHSWMWVMAACGALAGLGGTVNILGVQHTLFPGFTNYGFDAIALALLGRSNPLGVVLAALLFGVMRAGATGMQATTSTPVDIITIIQALIIVFMAAPALVRAIFRVKETRTFSSQMFTKGWSV